MHGLRTLTSPKSHLKLNNPLPNLHWGSNQWNWKNGSAGSSFLTSTCSFRMTPVMPKLLLHLQEPLTWWIWRDQDHRGSLTALHLLQYCRQSSWSLHTGCMYVSCWILAARGGPNSVAGTAKENTSVKNKQKSLVLLPKQECKNTVGTS